MHHRGGAYSETQLIYGDPLRISIKGGGRRFLSLGLGLGYNEILVAVECLRHGISPRQMQLLSFESEEALRSGFIQWLQGQGDEIYDLVAGFFAFDILKIKHFLLQALENHQWQLRHALDESSLSLLDSDFNCIFYDAFSSKTSPQLWTEEFLNLFFAKACSEISVVSTYACTGALKRSIKNQGFELLLKPGFNGKRLRTMGIRGWPTEIKDLFLGL